MTRGLWVFFTYELLVSWIQEQGCAPHCFNVELEFGIQLQCTLPPPLVNSDARRIASTFIYFAIGGGFRMGLINSGLHFINVETSRSLELHVVEPRRGNRVYTRG